jgi:putative transcriptional regulator
MIECRLSTILGAKRLKQADVLRATGLAKGTITALYYDRATRIDFSTLDKLCRFLGVQPGDILAFVDEKQAKPKGE